MKIAGQLFLKYFSPKWYIKFAPAERGRSIWRGSAGETSTGGNRGTSPINTTFSVMSFLLICTGNDATNAAFQRLGFHVLRRLWQQSLSIGALPDKKLCSTETNGNQLFLTWPDLTWPDLTWPDLTWPDLTWPDLTWPDLTWPMRSKLTLPTMTNTNLTFDNVT